MDAVLMPHQNHIAVVLSVNGQARSATAFDHQIDALRCAEEQRVINAEAPGLGRQRPPDSLNWPQLNR